MGIELLTRFEVWMIAGLTLLVLDLVLGLDFWALTAGVAAVLTGLVLLVAGPLLGAGQEIWQLALALFCLLTISLLVPIRRWLNRRLAGGLAAMKSTPDK